MVWIVECEEEFGLGFGWLLDSLASNSVSIDLQNNYTLQFLKHLVKKYIISSINYIIFNTFVIEQKVESNLRLSIEV